MELFTIERYVGDSQSTEKSSEEESQNLAQLLEQARGRKRLRENLNYKQEDEIKTDICKEESPWVPETLPKVRKNCKKKDKGNKLKRNVAEEHSLGNPNEDGRAKALERG